MWNLGIRIEIWELEFCKRGVRIGVEVIFEENDWEFFRIN